jgi:hypothetical protein
MTSRRELAEFLIQQPDPRGQDVVAQPPRRPDWAPSAGSQETIAAVSRLQALRTGQLGWSRPTGRIGPQRGEA